FVNACYGNDNFRTWLISRIAQQLAPAHWEFVPQPLSVTPPLQKSQHSLPRRWLSFSDVNGVRRWQRWALSAVIALRSKEPARFGPLLQPHSDHFPKGYREFVARLAREIMPASFGDGFQALDAGARRLRYKAGRIRATTARLHDDAFNLMLA